MTSFIRSLRSIGALSACATAAVFSACAVDESEGGGSGNAGMENGGATSGRSGSSGTGNSGAGKGGTTGTSGASGSSGTAGSSGTIGSSGRAGAGGSGGSNASGGASGSGGIVGKGGSAGSGGSAGKGENQGGSAGAGAAAGTGGDSGGSAGASGSGGSSGSASNCPPATPRSGGREFCSNSKGNAVGNYTYELWAEGGGSGCMTVFGADATFSATWSNVEDYLARVGLEFDRTRTPAEIGTITAEFAEIPGSKMEEGGGLTYIGIYGWTVNPLREYYILDDWGAVKPAGTASDGTPRTSVGTLTADGETYDVWMKTRVDKPAITGDNMTFDQYFSIRRSARQCGTISVSEHFSQWIELGLQVGDLVEVKLLVESQNNSGSIEFSSATVTVD